MRVFCFTSGCPVWNAIVLPSCWLVVSLDLYYREMHGDKDTILQCDRGVRSIKCVCIE